MIARLGPRDEWGGKGGEVLLSICAGCTAIVHKFAFCSGFDEGCR